MTIYLDLDDLTSRLHDEVEICGTQKAAALSLGISEQFFSEILRGNKKPSKKILKALGYERVVLYKLTGS